jgi:hypothetical protein
MTARKTNTTRFNPSLNLELLEDRSVPSIFTVTNTDDSGAGSLRQAITDANNNPNSGGPDRIEFNISGAGIQTIQPLNKLPDITDAVVIDGYTQPGASPNTLAVGNNAVLRIELNGGNGGDMNGLVITAPDTTIRGLAINGFTAGNSSSLGRGIAALGAGTTNLLIVGNFIGVNATGTAAIPNESHGIFILSAPSARVGGTAPADRNILSGNGARGLFANAPNLVVQGNYAGTSAAGTAAIPNFFEGIFVADNTGYQIGGTTTGAGNVISGNGFAGLTLNAARDSFVQGNRIGVGSDGITPLGNGDTGLFISNQAGPNTNNLVGGPGAAASNVIAFNAKNGILVIDSQATGNRLQNNSIFENGLLGIDLSNSFNTTGPTANDTGDADTGANGLQNTAVLTSAPIISGAARLNGSLNSVANETFRIEFFSVPIADAAGGEGRTFIGATEVTTDASGNATFQVIVNVPEGTIISSTATRLSTKDTSEFSNNVTALTAQGGTVSGFVFNDLNGDGVRQPGEPKLNGILVFLDANGNGVLDGEPAALSGPDGAYSLTSPVDGTFTAKAVAPAGATVTVTLFPVLLSGGVAFPGTNLGVALPPPPAPPAPPAPPPPAPTAPPAPTGARFATAAAGVVQVFNANNQLVLGITPYAGFTGNVAVTLGDVNRDGTPDVITGTAATSSHVKVFDGVTGAEIRSFLAFDGFGGGVNVASADINGDGYADVIVGTATWSSHVKVFDGLSGAEIRSFLAFDGFTGGVSVGAGDIDGDGIANILVSTARGSSHVKVFAGQTLVQSFLAFPGFVGGVRVGAVDRNGDGKADILVGTAFGAPAGVIFRGTDLRPLDSLLVSGGIGGVFVGPV